MYEAHHDCFDVDCEFCKGVLMQPHDLSNFFVENEEMCCEDTSMNYDKLHEFNCERSQLDERSKEFPSTLIPPPNISGECTRQVYVTELSVDLSMDFVSPHTIQDPVHVVYEESVLHVRLHKNDKDDIRRRAILNLLNDIMKDYGCKEGVYTFTTLKYNITAMQVSGEFYENFILDVVHHCLCFVMKKINDSLVSRRFRPMFSPSVVYLLKTLNAFRCAFDMDIELTSESLMNE